MRTFLSACLVIIFVLAGTAALAAHTVANTVLHPERAGRAAQFLIDEVSQSDLAIEAIEDYTGSPGLGRELDRTLESDPQLAREIDELLTTAKGTDSEHIKRDLARALRESGRPDLARKLMRTKAPTLPGAPDLTIPDAAEQVTQQVSQVRKAVVEFSLSAAVVAVLCAAGGIAVARSRRNVARGVANTIIGALASTLLVLVVLPWLLTSGAQTGWVRALGDGIADFGASLTAALVPFLIAGVALRIAAPFLPQSRTYRAGRGWRPSSARGADPARPQGWGAHDALPDAQTESTPQADTWPTRR